LGLPKGELYSSLSVVEEPVEEGLEAKPISPDPTSKMELIGQGSTSASWFCSPAQLSVRLVAARTSMFDLRELLASNKEVFDVKICVTMSIDWLSKKNQLSGLMCVCE